MSTWRVGVLFSRTGATAISETEHFLGTALAIEELNNSGGVLGKHVEPVVYDPASDPLPIAGMRNDFSPAPASHSRR
jgi:urea transport system substrate-binding protein